MRHVNQAGIALLHERESFVGHAYPDPYSDLGKALRSAGLWRKYLRAPFPIPESLRHLSGKPWTIGYGFTKGVREGDRMTMAQADARLNSELREYVDGVLGACTLEPNDNELAAMVALAWNIGLGWAGATKPRGAKDGFRQSTVLKCHNRGDKPGAARAFRLWNKANGEVSLGLESRRAAEAALYMRPTITASPTVEAPDDAESADDVMPQDVEPERTMTQSTINRAGIVAGGTATVATVAETVNTVSHIKRGVDELQDWLVPVLLVVSVCAVGYIVWERIRQRRGGWA